MEGLQDTLHPGQHVYMANMRVSTSIEGSRRARKEGQTLVVRLIGETEKRREGSIRQLTRHNQDPRRTTTMHASRVWIELQSRAHERDVDGTMLMGWLY